MRKLQHLRVGLVTVGTGLLFIGLAPASASSANLSKSYHSADPITAGSLVSLDATKGDSVQAANTSNAQRLLGVSVANNDSLLAVDVTSTTVQVATTGTASTLVSDLNGTVQVGDQIAVSPFSGIGMKAGPGMHIIGLAQSTLALSGTSVVTKTVTDTSGHAKQIKIGYLRVSISPGSASGGSDTTLNGLQKVVRNLTGKVIPTIRIVIALIILTVTLISAIVLIYGAIYGTIISIGRNPLAKYAVFRSLATVLVMVATAGIVAAIVIILLLR